MRLVLLILRRAIENGVRTIKIAQLKCLCVLWLQLRLWHASGASCVVAREMEG